MSCSVGKSGGQRTSRRAIPSSSIIAKVVVNWSGKASRTERPASSLAAQSRLEPRPRSSSATVASAAHRKRADEQASPPAKLRSDFELRCGIFVDPYEVAQGHRKDDLVGRREGVEAERVFEPRDEDGKAQRVEPRIQQHELVGEGRRLDFLLLRHLREL